MTKYEFEITASGTVGVSDNWQKLPLIEEDGLPHHGEVFPDGTNICLPDCPSCSHNSNREEKK